MWMLLIASKHVFYLSSFAFILSDISSFSASSGGQYYQLNKHNVKDNLSDLHECAAMVLSFRHCILQLIFFS